METDPTSNIRHTDLPSELGFALAPRETDPTPVVTHSSEAGRVEQPPAMVTRSRAREECRSGSRIPSGNRNPKEVIKQAEIQVSMPAICERGFGTTRQEISDTASQYKAADRPETTAAFSPSLKVVTENNPKLSETPKPPLHKYTNQS